MFGNWLGGSPVTSASQESVSEPDRIVVSEPTLVKRATMEKSPGQKTAADSDSDQSLDEEDFEKMIVSSIFPIRMEATGSLTSDI